jgi:hypothetical protein
LGSKGTFFLLPFPFFDTMVKNNGCGDKWVGRRENGVKVAFIIYHVVLEESIDRISSMMSMISTVLGNTVSEKIGKGI